MFGIKFRSIINGNKFNALFSQNICDIKMKFTVWIYLTPQ